MAVDGTWNVSVQSPMGEQKAQLVLKSAGGELTGQGKAMASTVDIANGKVDGDKGHLADDHSAAFPDDARL
ncbi:MAG: hypothetical protein WDN76_01700 [Alphaproteobacteria bacterium]